MKRDQKETLEAQALSAAVEMGLNSQLDDAEDLKVDVQTNLGEMVQGQVDSVSVAGHGLVMQKDIRVQELEIETDGIAINPLSVLFGEVELTHPTDATARIVLKEEDINRTLNSKYVRSKMRPFELNVDGQIVTLELQHLEIHLLSESQIECCGKITLQEKGNTRQLAFIALLQPRTSSQPLLLEAFQCLPGQGISLEVVAALMQKFKELLNLPYYELEGNAYRIKDMEVQKGSLTLYTEAHLRKMPSS